MQTEPQHSFRTRDGFELHEQVLCSNSHLLNPSALLELPCGRTLYIKHTKLRNGNVILDLHTQDTDWDSIRLESAGRHTNSISIRLGYDFSELDDGELPVKAEPEEVDG